MHTLSTDPSRPARIIPSYGGLVLQLEKAMQHGEARRFLTAPAVYGLSIPAEQFGQVLCYNGLFLVAGPACQFNERELSRAARAGSATQLNTEAGHEAAQLRLCRSQAEALAVLWALIVEHYQIPEAEAAAQVEAEQQRQAWAESPEGKAKLAQVQQWLADNQPELGSLASPELTAATTGTPQDWIPEYPASADEAQPA